MFSIHLDLNLDDLMPSDSVIIVTENTGLQWHHAQKISWQV